MIRLRMRLRRSGFQLGHVFSDMEIGGERLDNCDQECSAFQLGHVFSDMEIFKCLPGGDLRAYLVFQLGHVFSDMEMGYFFKLPDPPN